MAIETRTLLIAGLLIGLLLGGWLASRVPPDQTTEPRLATVEDLLAFRAELGARRPIISSGARTARLLLPESELYVQLRGLSESEHNAFMVQAIGIEMIEQQMMAAAFVAPTLSDADVAALSPDLVRFLQGAINRLSAVSVFPEGPE